ncbi:rhamnosidase [Streptomyces sp. W007]|uniref:alpha-L-rhamnosidase C-terminal domain-containing protein n=1 Tax=Streptomyces sp. W007 TaxID=1055352 RepID=UPI000241B895|nr:alpha-L-rhamnosidase C-terminal domain-containing protein [Streptomyces sp. W007]EHM26557.1 rhamnosidase [Streptomyces sp. W007]
MDLPELGLPDRPQGRFACFHGPVTTDWKAEKGRFRLTVTLPVNTTADVWIQAGRPEDVTHTGARFLRVEDGCAVFAVGSGHHRFET